MRETTISLPEELEAALDEAAREEGLSRDRVINKALADYLFVRKFRLLRDRMMRKTQTLYTDEDIFNQVS